MGGDRPVVEWAVQRRFPRFPIKLPILYKRKSPPVRAGAGWTRDVSEGGACLELAEPFALGTHLSVILQTDKGGIVVDAKVVWASKPEAAGAGVLHGVAFTQLAPEEHQALASLLVSKGKVRQAGVRLPAEFPVSCQRKGTQDPPFRGWTGDVSRAGLLLRLPEALQPATELEVSLPTGRGPVAAEGVIVWVEPAEARKPGELIRHGLKFTQIGWASELALGLLLAERP